ncbi:hypothetical protein CEXT_94721, partial [Caerostris extrusa]
MRRLDGICDVQRLALVVQTTGRRDEREQKQESLSSIPHLTGYPGGNLVASLLLLPGCGKSFGRWPSLLGIRFHQQ